MVSRQLGRVRRVQRQKILQMQSGAFIPVGWLDFFVVPVQFPQPERIVIASRQRAASVRAQTDGVNMIRVPLEGISHSIGGLARP